jgi:RNA polymerase-binding transcription factor DksA
MQKRVTRTQTSRKSRAKKAATNDILPNNGQPQKVPRKWAEHFKHLMELREKLSRERRTLKDEAAEESPTYSLHMADAGTDSYDRDWALGMLSTEQNALYEIEQALDRIRRGTYGICEATGKPIKPERLAAIPWTRFSADAEKQLESEGAADRARLGGRETVARTKTESQVGEEQS